MELLIYVTLASILGTPMVMIAVAVSRASAEGDMVSRILERNRVAIQRMTSELRDSLPGTTVISNGGKCIQFTSKGGFDGNGAVPGPVVRYEFRLAAGEVDNGKDDNGDGLIDEGTLVRLAGGLEAVITNTIRYSTSSFQADGTGVEITVTTTGRARGAPVPSDISSVTAVFPKY